MSKPPGSWRFWLKAGVTPLDGFGEALQAVSTAFRTSSTPRRRRSWRTAGVLSDLPALLRELADSELDPDHRDVVAFAASWNLALPPGRHHTHREFDWLNPENVEQVGRALDDVVATAVPRRALESA